jgi:hypothetical protein
VKPILGGERGRDRLAWAALALAAAAAAALLLWEGRGQTFFVDEWWFGFGARTGLGPSQLLSPDNGHLALVPILITKASLELFGATTTLPLRIIAIATHLTVALLFFLLARRAIGGPAALAPTVLILFLGSSSDLLVGSHALPMLIAVATGLGAWLALGRGTRLCDAAAAVLLVLGICSNGLALPFVAGAVAIVLLAPGGRRLRLWVPLAPLLLYAAWRPVYGGDSADVALVNIAGLPAFALDSLAAELAAISGLFAESGAQRQSFDPALGQAPAVAVAVAVLALTAAGRRWLPRSAVPAGAALLTFWILTGAVAGPARQPESARYLYPGAILLLLIVAGAVGTSPLRHRASLVLVGVCAVGLLPNLRELDYGGTFFREQSDQNRAVLAAADLLPTTASAALQLEIAAEETADSVADMRFPLGIYRSSAARFGSPAYDRAQLRSADAASRAAADRLLARALPVSLKPASTAPGALADRLDVSLEGGRLTHPHGCLRFEPPAPAGALIVELPPGGLWIRPLPGQAVPVALRRFGDTFAAAAGIAPGGQATLLPWGQDAARHGWEARLIARRPTLVCGVRAMDPRAGVGESTDQAALAPSSLPRSMP